MNMCIKSFCLLVRNEREFWHSGLVFRLFVILVLFSAFSSFWSCSAFSSKSMESWHGWLCPLSATDSVTVMPVTAGRSVPVIALLMFKCSFLEAFTYGFAYFADNFTTYRYVSQHVCVLAWTLFTHSLDFRHQQRSDDEDLYVYSHENPSVNDLLFLEACHDKFHDMLNFSRYVCSFVYWSGLRGMFHGMFVY